MKGSPLEGEGLTLRCEPGEVREGAALWRRGHAASSTWGIPCPTKWGRRVMVNSGGAAAAYVFIGQKSARRLSGGSLAW